MTTPTAYPLHWPSGWPKTPTDKREKGKFQSTLAGALNSLQTEISRLGGSGLVLSSNCTLGMDRPVDPGVVAYFQYQKQEVAIPCDRWQRVEHNVKAIALTIEAMRGMERWGAKNMIRAMFSGFKALPPSGKTYWKQVFGFDNVVISREQAAAVYKQLAKIRHPDAGGSDVLMAELNAAWEDAQHENGWR